MAVGFMVDCFFYEIGSGDFLHSFFSTISHQFETEGWGTKYPYLLSKLYNDKLLWTEVKEARDEAIEIQNKLKQMHADQAIWDIDNLAQQPPWGDNISSKVTNLENYFATSDGRTFLEVLLEALDTSEEDKCDVQIRKL